ncbi:RNA polymerase II transcription mediator complex subunit 9-domain-containing protein [Coniochaeta sp. 2T2.1]|nr:RNA polymerase II transcription mediator complex subunit 9-domain-containing protein [Coniochaeta sp. 2T2.1]
MSNLSPDLFSPLPPLSEILLRLRPPPPNTSSSSSSQQQQQQPLSSPAPPNPSTPTVASSTTGPLSLKEVPAATDPIKHRLQRARQQVKALPDIERGVREQEEEIEELERRIEEQRRVLGVLKGMGLLLGRRGSGGVGMGMGIWLCGDSVVTGEGGLGETRREEETTGEGWAEGNKRQWVEKGALDLTFGVIHGHLTEAI